MMTNWGDNKSQCIIQCMCVCVCAHSFSHVWLFVTPWTVAHQASPSMGFSRQEYWSGLPFPPTGNLPEPGIELASPALQVDSLLAEPQRGSPRILEWIAYPFSSESSQPRNWTGVSCIAGRFFMETSKSLKFQHRFYVFFYQCFSFLVYVKNFERDGNTRPPDQPLEKSVCRSGSNS